MELQLQLELFPTFEEDVYPVWVDVPKARWEAVYGRPTQFPS